ncbi:4a-hydroxytetrahydrobiopterin dehydratase [Candidatus Gottesmanbacteria bacterium]|nr:4a-hydroxytetrahydrobiopterin dehydratase [Candidatus Gottesmanbacteria bacterium]
MDLVQQRCKPCEGGTKPFTQSEVEHYLASLSGWEFDQQKKISKRFKCKNFVRAIEFVNTVSKIAEREGHHPNICIYYSTVKFELFTHAIGGLSINDFIMAAKIDQCFHKNSASLS